MQNAAKAGEIRNPYATTENLKPEMINEFR